MAKKVGCSVGQRKTKGKCIPDKYIYTSSLGASKSGKIIIKKGDIVTLLEKGKTHNVILLKNDEIEAISKGFWDDGSFKKI